MTQRFSGWHMFALLVGFFGVVIAVNVVMATKAIRSFSGTVVEDSYVASQDYNHWLAEAQAQDRAGWKAAVGLDPHGVMTATLTTTAGAVEGAKVTVLARQPIGDLPAQTLILRALGQGRYCATKPLPAGRWLLHIHVRAADGHEARFEDAVGFHVRAADGHEASFADEVKS